MDRIFPPALMLLFIGVLAITPRSSLTTFLVTAGAAAAVAAAAAASGCATSWTGVLAVSLEVGGPRLGRRRLSPNPSTKKQQKFSHEPIPSHLSLL